ncbi:MAG: hypothetical protein ACRD3F_08135 [Acidobacteriaceae bacterium]
MEATFLPDFGGKMISLTSIRTGEEFLLPPLHPYKRLEATEPFEEGDAGGFDECLPSVAACEAMGQEPPVADHGDLWRLAWETEATREMVRMQVDAVSRPLRLVRTAAFRGRALVLRYDLYNLSERAVPWLWSAHPLFKISAGDRILLPGAVGAAKVESSCAGDFNEGSVIAWPHAHTNTGNLVDLSTIRAADGRTAHKLFVSMQASGWAALYRAELGQGVLIRFDPRILPFLGLWICHGAWPAQGLKRQYTVALEPTTSDADSLTKAAQRGTGRTLEPLGHTSWEIEMELLGAESAISYEDMLSMLEGSRRPAL